MPRPHICSLILVYVSQHRWLNVIGQKKAPPLLVGHLYRDTHNRDREKSSELVFVYLLRRPTIDSQPFGIDFWAPQTFTSGQANLFNI